MEHYQDLPSKRNIISVRITDDERNFLLRLIDGREMTLSDLMREALGRLTVFPPASARKSRRQGLQQLEPKAQSGDPAQGASTT
ncbi:hypothetical protein [Geomonas ferrireducens]|jgi:hypothetical protein|uniref:hypothetical protein n=1 Tax=Geomonas ferrireducens TaxID=2570227 RepID=UPI0010A89C78|nr:hypothetical protein [Geomonas ferrireducens]